MNGNLTQAEFVRAKYLAAQYLGVEPELLDVTARQQGIAVEMAVWFRGENHYLTIYEGPVPGTYTVQGWIENERNIKAFTLSQAYPPYLVEALHDWAVKQEKFRGWMDAPVTCSEDYEYIENLGIQARDAKEAWHKAVIQWQYEKLRAEAVKGGSDGWA